MQWGTVRGGLGSRPLLPGPRRATGIGLLIACLAAFLAAFLGGRASAGGLDAVIDPRIQAALSRFPALLNWLPDLGTLGPAALMTLVLVLAGVAACRWSGAVLAAIAVPGATGLTEYVLKPSVGASLGQGFPSGHATSMFALAAVCAVLLAGPPYHCAVGALRLLVVLAALGIGVVLACALTLDLAASRARRAPAEPPDPAA